VVIPSGVMEEHPFYPLYLGAYTQQEIQGVLMNRQLRDAMSYRKFKQFQLADFYLATIQKFLSTTSIR
jgi:hypothetical protein